MPERVIVFIDGSNLDITSRNRFSRRISPELLVTKLVGQRRLMKVCYYEAPLIPTVNVTSFNAQQQFFERLRKKPHFEVRLGRRVKRDKDFFCSVCNTTVTMTGYEQKGVDSLIVFDLVALAYRDAYDIAILVAGDQDFACPILEVRMMGRYVENAFIDSGWASELKEVCDKTVVLDQAYLQSCWQ